MNYSLDHTPPGTAAPQGACGGKRVRRQMIESKGAWVAATFGGCSMVRLPFVLAVSMVAMAALTLSPAQAKSPDAISAAIADAGRSDADKQRDANRKPAETLAFAGVKPGDRVAELLPGGGYFTRLFSKIVGAGGHVYALVPAPSPNAPPDAPDFASWSSHSPN